MVIQEWIGVMGNYDTFYVSLLEMVIVISAFPRKIKSAPFTLYFILITSKLMFGRYSGNA